ncbi:hypothetical protein EGR_09775 [Echinococcus granulosus]|uniref:Uncharacterized protein n=1 Tax=Echinococcus granulosus TaxID=6210 RepID=W6UPP2_ECHGR|nr:hypothetical protein EGR_09775 [Echinococcus granulosus]EUB55369.1 hypothetical protein EGR_09775 [Echinococcus granulosus]
MMNSGCRKPLFVNKTKTALEFPNQSTHPVPHTPTFKRTKIKITHLNSSETVNLQGSFKSDRTFAFDRLSDWWATVVLHTIASDKCAILLVIQSSKIQIRETNELLPPFLSTANKVQDQRFITLSHMSKMCFDQKYRTLHLPIDFNQTIIH